MVQVINRTPLIGESLGKGFAEGFSQTLGERLSEKRKEDKNRSALSALESEEDFKDLDFTDQMKLVHRHFVHDLPTADKIGKHLFEAQTLKAKEKSDAIAAKRQAFEDKRKVESDVRAEKKDARAEKKTALEQEKFEAEKLKSTTAANLSIGEKEEQKRASNYALDIMEGAPSIKGQQDVLKRAKVLSKNLEGFVSGGFKTLFKTKDASEFDSLGVMLAEPAIHVLVPRGTISKEKMELLKERVLPKATDYTATKHGKLKAIELIMGAAQDKVNRMEYLTDKYGSVSKIPPAEVFKLRNDSDQFVDQIMNTDMDDLGVKVEEQEIQNEVIAPSQQQPPPEVPPQPAGPQEPPLSPPTEAAPAPEVPLQAPVEKALVPSQPAAPVEKAAPAPEAKKDEPKAAPKKEEPESKSWVSYLDPQHQKTIKEIQDVSDYYQKRQEKTNRQLGIAGRGGTKAIGNLADFGNLLVKMATGSGAPVQEITKTNFGKEMDFTELAEKAFDYVTSDEFIPKGAVERTLEKGAQVGVEFALPAGMMKSAKTGLLFLEGALAGTLSNTAKEADLGSTMEIAPYLLTPMAAFSKKGAAAAREIATNPKAFSDWWGRTKKFFSETKESIKESVKKPYARYAVKKLGLEGTKTTPERITELQKRGLKRSPASEVFESERLYDMEASVASQAEAAEIYKPLYEHLNAERKEKYGEFLSTTANQRGQELLKKVSHPESKKEIQKVFETEMTRELGEVRKDINIGYNTLTKLRTDSDRISWADTKNLINWTDKSIKEIKLGGIGKYDKPVLEYLESFKAGLLQKTPEVEARIGELESEVKAMKMIKPGSSAYAENVAPRLKELKKLDQQGAQIKHLEKGHRKINANTNWSKELNTPQYEPLKLKERIENSIINYGNKGDKQKKYSDLFFKTKKKYANAKEAVLSDMMWKFTAGEEPKLLTEKLLNTVEGIDWFKKALLETNQPLEVSAVANEVITAKVHEILTSKVFNAEGKVKATIGNLSSREENLMNALVGTENYDTFKHLATEFGENEKKVNAYINTSRSFANAKGDLKKAGEVAGFFNIARGLFRAATGSGGLGQVGKGVGQIGLTKADRVTAILLTDHGVQKEMIKIVKESKEGISIGRPVLRSMKNLWNTIWRAGWKQAKKEGRRVGKTASLSDMLGIEEEIYPEDE